MIGSRRSWRTSLAIGLPTITLISLTSIISFSIPPTLSNSSNLISLELTVHHEDGSTKELRYSPRPLAPVVGSTNVSYEREVAVTGFTVSNKLRLVYWGTLTSWECDGNVTLHVRGPSGKEESIVTRKVLFARSPPPSTETLTASEFVVPLGGNIWMEGDGAYTLRFAANVTLTIILNPNTVQHASGNVEATVKMNVVAERAFVKAANVSTEFIYPRRQP